MLRKLAEYLVLPPSSLFGLAAVGLCLWKRRPRLARWLVGTAAAVLFVLFQPYVGSALLKSLQRHGPIDDPVRAAEGAGAIVVLTAASRPWAPEYGGATVGALTLERLRYAARLARETGLPILPAGGRPRSGLPSLAEMCREALEQDFGTPVRWTEGRSANTRQNLAFAAEILRAEGIDSVLIVTHAWHMPRALAESRRVGLTAVPAPMGFQAWPAFRWNVFVPSAAALLESRWALHEWVGRAWYALTR